MAWLRLTPWGLLLALACDPDGGGMNASATDGDASTGTGSTTATTSEGGGAGTGSATAPTSGGASAGGGTDLNVELECADPRWVHDVYGFSDIWDVAIDGRGHVRVPHWLKSGVYEVLDLDLDGSRVAALELDVTDGFVRWGGVDDAGNVVLEYGEVIGENAWLRKYAVSGALLWEIDLYAIVGYPGPPPLVAPDGTIVVTGQTSIFKFDADGGVVWELPNPQFMSVSAVNAAGVMVAPVLTTTRVRALGPDGAELWERDWGDQALSDRFFAIDASGAVVIGERFKGIARFTADGTMAWERSEEEIDVQIGRLAMNADGALAVLGDPISQIGRPVAVLLDVAGEIVGTRKCGQFHGTQLAIDGSGRIAVSGYTFDNGSYDWFAVAFD